MNNIKINEETSIDGINKAIFQSTRIVFNYPCEDQFTCFPIEVELQRGKYLFELWGAEGGSARKVNSIELIENGGGRGAFVSGIIKLHDKTKFYLYIGSKGEDQTTINNSVVSRGGYNGGGDGGIDELDSGTEIDPVESSAGGGGSTDIRLERDSLNSRIIVAGAGGGACSTFGYIGNQCTLIEKPNGNSDLLCKEENKIIKVSPYGGHAGTLHGYRTNTVTYPGNQTEGSFGQGMNGISMDATGEISGGSTGGGGSGYFGGTTAPYTSTESYMAGGAGGSSYVSGCEGCRSVESEQTTTTTTTTTDNQIHYSKLSFTHIKMYSGIENFASPTGTIEKGHTGNGAIAITLLQQNLCTRNNIRLKIIQIMLIIQTQFIDNKI